MTSFQFFAGVFLLVSVFFTDLKADPSSTAVNSTVPIRPRFNEDPGRIINGTLAAMEATRHQVGIRKALNDGYFYGTGHLCGGALIRPNFVLSAAHCFVDQIIYDGTFVPIEEFIVVMGNLDRFNSTNALTFTIAERFMLLDKFVLATYDKDIALLRLNDSVPTNHPTIRPIALNRNEIVDGVVCQVTGWGLTEEGYNSDYLMTLDVPVIGEQRCVEESDLGSLILPGMMCAGYLEEGQKDACSGDSGGPLVCQSKLAGIVSWGINCALPKLPGVYTEVSYYYDWVLEKMGEDDGSGDHSGSGDGDDDGSGDHSGSGDGDDDDNGGGGSMTILASSISLILPLFVSLRLMLN
ncbi:uncharacterized protein Dana_GF22085 [Drosophila ananassae]|uniref:Peptidase S1 domain-containing protein n=1 Tax=Drosophila ananassae TaxID=7217 RepID=B3MY87_DROAN|nr:trypsin eta [Drosophila ananassae]EDV32581.1 uncharacterized protein Dana_GF22085 [Drosophila ananassae]